MYERIVVVGMSGCGKTTLARHLAQQLALTHVELDALYWGAGWQAAAPDVFRERVATALQTRRWSVDGNYRRVRDITWGQADTVLWLDYSLTQIYRWLIPRTLRRVVTQETLWNGNREPWNEQFNRNSLLWYAWQQHGPKRREYQALFADAEYADCQRVRLRTPRATQQWLEQATHDAASHSS